MTISNRGLNDLANGLVTGTAPTFNWIGVCNSSTGFSATQNTLGNQLIRKSVTNINQTTTGQVVKRVTIETTDIVGQSHSEVGAFSANTGGNMLDRIIYATTLHAGTSQTRIEIQFTWKR